VEIPFVDMGLDSVTGVEWVQSLNKQYRSNLTASCVYDYPTIRQLARFLEKEGLTHQRVLVPSLPILSLDEDKAGSTIEINPGLAQGMGIEPLGRKEAIAIVGMSGKYPNANNLTDFWDNLVQGKHAIREIPLSRFAVSDYYDPDPDQVGKI